LDKSLSRRKIESLYFEEIESKKKEK